MRGTRFASHGSVYVNRSLVAGLLADKQFEYADTVADGNCWFRMCSQALYGHEECHETMRAEVTTRVQLMLKSGRDFGIEIPDGFGDEAALLRQLGQRCAFVEGDLPCIASADVFGLDLQVWFFQELTSTLANNDVYHFVGKPPTHGRRRTSPSNLRQWHAFNHRSHASGWNPDAQSNAQVYVYVERTGAWVEGNVVRVLQPRSAQSVTLYAVALDDGDTVKVPIKYLHQRQHQLLIASK